MASSKCKIKTGMGGSRCGKSRTDLTATLKSDSKKRRRRQAKSECMEREVYADGKRYCQYTGPE